MNLVATRSRTDIRKNFFSNKSSKSLEESTYRYKRFQNSKNIQDKTGKH